jgi:predicted hydrocarbon binding protein
MWQPLLKNASLAHKVQIAITRRLPTNPRRKQTLDMLAAFLSADKGDVTVHSLDLDLLLADHTSPGTLDITAEEPICYVTQGLVREALYWATGHPHDIEETSCRALGEEACEFTITTGSQM